MYNMNEHFFIYDGTFFLEGTPVISTGNRSLMYGDGLFETMLVYRDSIINKNLHFERFFHGIRLLKFSLRESFSEEYFIQKIQDLLQRNNIEEHARVRLMAFRNTDDLQKEKSVFNYIVEAWPIGNVPKNNEVGLKTGLFRDVTKSCDQYSNIKSNNYLPSIMAMIFAKENDFDECLLLNSNGRICESAIGNVFIIKDQIIYTPPLSEGCVAGIVRRWIIENLPSDEFQLIEKEITVEEVIAADEIFLTNSIKLIRRVASFDGTMFEKKVTDKIAKYVFKHMLKADE